MQLSLNDISVVPAILFIVVNRLSYMRPNNMADGQAISCSAVFSCISDVLTNVEEFALGSESNAQEI